VIVVPSVTYGLLRIAAQKKRRRSTRASARPPRESTMFRSEPRGSRRGEEDDWCTRSVADRTSVPALDLPHTVTSKTVPIS